MLFVQSGTNYIFTNQTTNGASTGVILGYPDQKMLVTAWGTWDGADITLQTLAADNITWINIPVIGGSSIAFLDNSQLNVNDFIQNQKFRAVLANAGPTTDINLTIQEV